MTINPVYQIGTTLPISKESPRRISLIPQSSDSTSYTPKDTITISAAARQLASKMTGQSGTTQPSTYLNASQQSSVATTNLNQMRSSSTNYSSPILTPSQKDLAAFIAGKSFQEELNESLTERLQEKFEALIS
jgi:hypothetical protein